MQRESIFHLMEKGKIAFDSGKYEEAKKYFEEFIEHNKNFADVYCKLGYIYFVKDEYHKAIDFFKQAVEINPSYTEALINLATSLQYVGENDEALKYMNQLKSVTYLEGIADKHCLGKISNMHAEIADAYVSLFLYKNAIDEYEKALELNPGFPDIRLKYAIALREYGDFERAIFVLENIIMEMESFVDAYVQLGITYYKIGYIGFAISAWKKGFELNKNNKLLNTFLYLVEAAKEVD
ncbi:tetratricopeptide repeat protein [Deferribacterales bacterium Es71-Z0220]|uniref:tetratricopeptide repeat protein n=1 Tax=Deferrivibrio essentukiensis TaxID=2880922 RepID=UPI001F61FAA1|nr:tetratricopeptide repeat protein [Deferrivibrio essentukiensis]MCB4203803.1 tetratricopeptide repeat protein [Deferrivibrio essentukiensis]